MDQMSGRLDALAKSADRPCGASQDGDSHSDRLLSRSPDHPITRSPGSAVFKHYELIPSDIQNIDGAVGRALDLVEESGCCQDVGDIRLALHEALLNAMVHGNHRDPNKYVRMSVEIEEAGKLTITVEDSGSGFDPTMIPDPTEGDNIYRDCGRGMYLIQRLMDEVEYKFQNGTVLTMRRHPLKSSP